MLPGITEDLETLREAAEAARKAKSEKAKGDRKDDKAAKDAKSSKDGKDGKGAAKDEKKGPRASFSMPTCSGARTAAASCCRRFGRQQDRWIVSVDLASKTLVSLERLHDEAWVNGAFNEMGWLRDSKRIWYLRRDRLLHLYVRPVAPGGTSARSPAGRSEFPMALTRDGSHFYAIANREHPGVKEVYRIALRDGETERITALEGQTDFVLSPSETDLLLTTSFRSRPPELYLQAAQPAPRRRSPTRFRPSTRPSTGRNPRSSPCRPRT